MTQPFADRAHGGVVVRDDSHVVPVASFKDVGLLDAPYDVFRLFVGRAVQRGFQTAIARQRIGLGQCDNRQARRQLRQFARPLRQRNRLVLRGSDGQGDTGCDQIAIRITVDVVHRTLLNSAISGTASRQTNHAGAKLTTNLVEQVFRI